jgi:hypothetical protein
LIMYVLGGKRLMLMRARRYCRLQCPRRVSLVIPLSGKNLATASVSVDISV